MGSASGHGRVGGGRARAGAGRGAPLARDPLRGVSSEGARSLPPSPARHRFDSSAPGAPGGGRSCRRRSGGRARAGRAAARLARGTFSGCVSISGQARSLLLASRIHAPAGAARLSAPGLPELYRGGGGGRHPHRPLRYVVPEYCKAASLADLYRADLEAAGREDEERVRVIAAAAADVAASAAATDAYRVYVMEVAFNRAYEAALAVADTERARV